MIVQSSLMRDYTRVTATPLDDGLWPPRMRLCGLRRLCRLGPKGASTDRAPDVCRVLEWLVRQLGSASPRHRPNSQRGGPGRLVGVRCFGESLHVKPADLAHAQAVLDDTTFRRVRHVVTENERVLETVAALRGQGPGGIGAFLLASHASMRYDFEISTPELDAAVYATINAGAIGARMTGGGFGGSAIAFVPVELVPAAEQAVRTAFANAGFAAPDVFQVRAAAGAAILDQEVPA